MFEGTRYSLRTILWAAYLMLQIPFGLASLLLACLLEEEGRRLAHKDAPDLTRRIQTALIEPQPRFGSPTQIDASLMGYANGIRTNVIGDVDTSTGRAWVGADLRPGELGQFIPLHQRPRRGGNGDKHGQHQELPKAAPPSEEGQPRKKPDGP